MKFRYFNLGDYNSGNYDVITRCGYIVKNILVIDNPVNKNYPIIGDVYFSDKPRDNIKLLFTSSGKYLYGRNSKEDLFLIPKRVITPNDLLKFKVGDYVYFIHGYDFVVSYRIYSKDIEDKEFFKSLFKSGNYFRTKKEALSMAKKFKDMLKQNINKYGHNNL